MFRVINNKTKLAESCYDKPLTYLAAFTECFQTAEARKHSFTFFATSLLYFALGQRQKKERHRDNRGELRERTKTRTRQWQIRLCFHVNGTDIWYFLTSALWAMSEVQSWGVFWKACLFQSVYSVTVRLNQQEAATYISWHQELNGSPDDTFINLAVYYVYIICHLHLRKSFLMLISDVITVYGPEHMSQVTRSVN